MLMNCQTHISADFIANMCFEEFVHSFCSSVVAPKLSCSTVDGRGNLVSPVTEGIQHWFKG